MTDALSLSLSPLYIFAVMDGLEFTQRWRVREEKNQVSPSRRGSRQKIIGMSANSEATEIQVNGGVNLCYSYRT